MVPDGPNLGRHQRQLVRRPGPAHLYFGLTDELMAIAHSDHTANYQKNDYAYRSTDLSNNYFVRNGKAEEWAEKDITANANM